MPIKAKKVTTPPSGQELRERISAQAERIEGARQRLDVAEVRLSKQVMLLANLVRTYNRERLDGLIQFLAGKGVAYFPCLGNSTPLVKESDLSFVTQRGTRGEYFGEYDSYYREVSYEHTSLELSHLGTGSDAGVTVRAHWIKTFKNDFATTPNHKLPSWLTIAIDKEALPPEPIGCEAPGWYGANAPEDKTLKLRRSNHDITIRFRESDEEEDDHRDEDGLHRYVWSHLPIG